MLLPRDTYAIVVAASGKKQNYSSFRLFQHKIEPCRLAGLTASVVDSGSCKAAAINSASFMRTEQANVLLAWDAEAMYIFKKVVVISKTIPVSSFIAGWLGSLLL